MSDTELRRLGWGAYGVAFLLIMVPITDSLLSVWPLRVGQVTWRFGAVGIFSQTVMTPVFGLLIALVTAVYMRHRRVTRLLSILGFLGAGMALVGMVFFALDALQTRAQVRPDAATAFDTAAVVAMIKYVLGTAVAVLLGVGGWKASRGGTEVAPKRAPGVLVSAAGADTEEQG